MLALLALSTVVLGQSGPPTPPESPAKKSKALQSPKAAAEGASKMLIRSMVRPAQVEISWVHDWPSDYDVISGGEVLTNTTAKAVVFPFLSGTHVFRVLAHAATNFPAIVTVEGSADTNVLAYNVYYGITTNLDMPDFTDRVMFPFEQPSGGLTNLAYGHTYYLTATAIGLNGLESEYSPAVTFTTPDWDTNKVDNLRLKITLKP